MKICDLPTTIHGEGHQILPQILEAIKTARKAQYLLFATVHELESQVLEALKQTLPLKIYALGLAIPHSDVWSSTPTVDNEPHYLKWLDAQPDGSVLYISQGSYLSFSNAQLEEIMAGLLASGVQFLWAGRLEKDEYCGGKGLVVPWCDQLKVLSHPSMGGFWSHCGWNSTKEGAFAGLPMLTFSIMRDQVTNSKLIVDVWKIGLRVKKGEQNLVGRDEVAEAVMEVMDSNGVEAKERRRLAKKIREVCRSASLEGGSSHVDVMAFIRDVCGC